MTRVKGGTVARARRKEVLKEAKGYFGSKHRLYKTAHEQVMHSGNYAFRDRRQNKRNFRKLWIARINAGCRENEISYSKFINGLNLAGVTITEGEKEENGDWLLFGYCHLFEWEWGYVLLSELESVRLPFGLKIERELYSSGGTVKDYLY